LASAAIVAMVQAHMPAMPPCLKMVASELAMTLQVTTYAESMACPSDTAMRQNDIRPFRYVFGCHFLIRSNAITGKKT
jgi:hypothetical protein